MPVLDKSAISAVGRAPHGPLTPASQGRVAGEDSGRDRSTDSALVI